VKKDVARAAVVDETDGLGGIPNLDVDEIVPVEGLDGDPFELEGWELVLGGGASRC